MSSYTISSLVLLLLLGSGGCTQPSVDPAPDGDVRGPGGAVDVLPRGRDAATLRVSPTPGTVVRPSPATLVGPNTEMVAPVQYAVGGLVSGLVGTGLVLKDEGGDDLAIDGDGAFTFATPIASGVAYAVTVATQPMSPSQTCVVASASGHVDGGAISDIVVTCTTNGYAVGGMLSGLRGTLVLANGSDELTLTADGAFTFGARVASGNYYAVEIVAQPDGQHCVVSAGADRIDSSDARSMLVSCHDASCVNLGWHTGSADWTCPAGHRLPTAGEYAAVSPCLDPGDLTRFSPHADIAVAVGGCGCGWNTSWCDEPSIETMREGRICGDYDQLHVCVAE